MELFFSLPPLAAAFYRTGNKYVSPSNFLPHVCFYIHSSSCLPRTPLLLLFFPARDKVLENKNINSLFKSTPLCWPAELNSSGAGNLAVFFSVPH